MIRDTCPTENKLSPIHGQPFTSLVSMGQSTTAGSRGQNHVSSLKQQNTNPETTDPAASF